MEVWDDGVKGVRHVYMTCIHGEDGINLCAINASSDYFAVGDTVGWLFDSISKNWNDSDRKRKKKEILWFTIVWNCTLISAYERLTIINLLDDYLGRYRYELIRWQWFVRSLYRKYKYTSNYEGGGIQM